VGLVETSIGKMVPIMPQDIQDKDCLLVFAEPYNTLILDKKAFKIRFPMSMDWLPKTT
jgi:mannitol-1-phosphate 5-dehydrogenase